MMRNVCIVDDDVLYTYGIKRLLKKATPDSEVSTFKNGEEAIIAITSSYEATGNLPDVIFLDLNMPRMNGWEFLKQFEELKGGNEKDVKVFVISSQVNEKQEEIYRVEWDSKVSDFIQKPVDAKGILKLLQQH